MITSVSNRAGYIWNPRCYSSADEKRRRPILKCSLSISTRNIEDSIEKIRERLTNNGYAEMTPSAYDTAWVAMVPSREYSGGGGSGKPCFSRCLDWIMENQNPDGSWDLDPGHPSLVKDSLSCTLACVLALRKWNLGDHQIQKGLDYIGSNGWAICHKDQISPIGFDIIFPSMISSARGMGLNLMLPDLIKTQIHNLDPIYESVRGDEKYRILGYVAEGLGQSCNWNELLKIEQRSNGSLFNSPATTAAALIHSHNEKCLDYLLKILEIHKSWVPTIFRPMGLYDRLCMIDTLERLGIHWHFKPEITSVLDQTYRYWKQKDEEIFADVTCLAVAFRLLRMQGYDVSSDELAAFSEQEKFFNRTSIQFTGVPTIMELYRASELAINEEESVLDKIQYWTSRFLKQNLIDHSIPDKTLHKQVEYAMETFYCTLDRVENRRSIELYNTDIFRMSKTAYRCSTIGSESFLLLAQNDFMMSRAQQQKELQQLQRWFTDSRLDGLKYGRNTLHISHFVASAVLLGPQLSDARIAFTQAAVLITYMDDFFDKHASIMELLDLVEFIHKWDEPTTGYRTKELEILFTAVYNNVNELASKAFITQGRSVKEFLVSLWLDWVKSQRKEFDWTANNIVPSMEEHLSNACMTIAGNVCIFTPLLFVGPKLPEELLRGKESNGLWYHTSLVTRLLNDLQTFKKERESSERAINSVNLLLERGEGAIEEEEAIATINEMIKNSTRKLLKMVVTNNGSEFPRECKNLFWNTARIGYYLYSRSDEFTNPREKILPDMKAAMSPSIVLIDGKRHCMNKNEIL